MLVFWVRTVIMALLCYDIRKLHPSSGNRKLQPCQFKVADNRLQIIRAAGNLREQFLDVRENQKSCYPKSEYKTLPKSLSDC